MPTRDERADLRSGAGVVEGQRGDGQPVKRSKPRVGHGVQRLSATFTDTTGTKFWLHSTLMAVLQ